MTRRRFRNLCLGLAFYAAAGGAVGYFAYHAHHGQRGLHAKAAFKARTVQLDAEIKAVRMDKGHWERRVAQLRSDNLDRDLLDERSRALLNLAHRNDVVVLRPR